MKHFKKILICTHPDFTDMDIVERAANIAKNCNAQIKVLHVIGDYPEDLSEWWNVRNPEKLRAKIVRDRQGFLDGVVERIKEIGVMKVESELRWGKEFLEITREVLRNHHDLVCLTSRRKSKLAKLLLECPSRDLLHYCPCALWITRGKVRKRFKRIAAALGNKRKNEALNTKILETAASIADSEGSELHIIHAMPIYGRKGLKSERLGASLMKQLEQVRQEIKEGISPLLAESGPQFREDRIHILTGSPVAAISEFVKEMGMDLVVMGATGHATIPQFVAGNTAERVLDEIECGVLAVKPDNFVSVIELEDKSNRKKAQLLGR
jgi:universal stress protein E